MKIRDILCASVMLFSFVCMAETPAVDKMKSTRSMAEGLMRSHRPTFEFDPTFSPEEFSAWQKGIKKAMTELMKHPDIVPAQPRKAYSAKRDGYTIEKWITYPFENAEVGVLLLIPDGITPDNPAPAALCIPGFGQTKELLAGERKGNFTLSGEADSTAGKNAMALNLVREGIVALAVDNPSCGELSDNGYFDYITSSRFLLEMGWSYLGLASWQDRVALEWLKSLDFVRTDRIIVSGFSLGTEPLMALGLMDDSIYAFVYNDFLCRTRERALVMNKPNKDGSRGYPNSIEHLIPSFLSLFDFPDIVAALAPRPVICTEGGMDRDFGFIQKAYAIAGAPENFEFHHYEKFKDPGSRQYLDSLPDGIDRADFFKLVNCDPPHHYFKTEHVMPWLHKLLDD